MKSGNKIERLRSKIKAGVRGTTEEGKGETKVRRIGLDHFYDWGD